MLQLSRTCLPRQKKTGKVWAPKTRTIQSHIRLTKFRRSSDMKMFHIDTNHFQDESALHDLTRKGLGDNSGWKKILVTFHDQCVSIKSRYALAIVVLLILYIHIFTGLDSIILRGAEWIEQVKSLCFTTSFYWCRKMKWSSTTHHYRISLVRTCSQHGVQQQRHIV